MHIPLYTQHPIFNTTQYPTHQTQVPSQVDIVCGPQRGRFDVAGGFCLLAGNNRRVSPTEFERLGGKGSSKKWKVSIRVDLGGGTPGSTLADWFVTAGLEAPSAQRMARAAASLRASSTRGSSRVHPPSCTCGMCSQARHAAGAAGPPGGALAGLADEALGRPQRYYVYPRLLDPTQERHRLPQFNYVPSNDKRKRDSSLVVPSVHDPLVCWFWGGGLSAKSACLCCVQT